MGKLRVHPFTEWLSSHPYTSNAIIAITASIGYMLTYFIRYPLFVLPTNNTELIGGMDEKTWYSLASNVGYGLSKVPAYFIVSTIARKKRFKLIVILCCLMLFLTVGFWKWLPVQGRIVAVLLGAIPGSWVYAIVFSYLEGRQTTDVLNAVLNLSIIYGGAMSRAVGDLFVTVLPDADWMPLAAACSILPISIGCFVLLSYAPEPTQADIIKREFRRPMGGAERYKFLSKYFPGILGISTLYAMIISYRSFRDYFALEIYTSVLGRKPEPWVYLAADFPAGALSSLVMLAMVKLKDSKTAVLTIMGVVFFGSGVVGVSALVFDETGDELPFLIGVGCGVYLMWACLPALLYDRLLAASNTQGTVVFCIFLSDWAGYVGTTGLLLYKGLGAANQTEESLKDLFVLLSYVLSVLGLGITSLVAFYFYSVLPSTVKGSSSSSSSGGGGGDGGGSGGGNGGGSGGGRTGSPAKGEHTPLLADRGGGDGPDALMGAADAMFERNATPITELRRGGGLYVDSNDGRRSVNNLEEYDGGGA